MNLVIVGFGNVGKHYFNLLRKNKKIKKVYVLENNPKVISGHKCNFINFNQIKKKISTINYAIICTPSYLHYKYAYFFLKNKVNTLIEKPFVISLIHAKKLIKLKNRIRNVKCWVAFQNRYNLAIKKGLQLNKNRRFGNPFFVDAALYWHRNNKYYSTSWRGKYISDGGVLFNQAIHLLDMIIYFFGPIKKFNIIAGFNKKKLQAEDLFTLNLVHKNNIISNLKATTRSDKDYEMSMNVLCNRGRYMIKGISLNKIFYFNQKNLIIDKKNSEIFPKKYGPIYGMGSGHKKILKEFLNNKIRKSSKELSIENNYYILKLIHSIYNSIFKEKKYSFVTEKEFIYDN